MLYEWDVKDKRKVKLTSVTGKISFASLGGLQLHTSTGPYFYEL
jgi:hypothetical protein